MQLDSMYQEIILDHYRHPHRKGLRDGYGAEVHHVNPTCGDEVTLRVHLKDAALGGRAVIEDVSYESQGCSISQASASVLTDLVVGKPVDEALRIHDAFLELMQSKGAQEGDEEVLEDAVAFAGVSKFPARVKCALLSWMALKDASARALAGAAEGAVAADGEATGTPESVDRARSGSRPQADTQQKEGAGSR